MTLRAAVFVIGAALCLDGCSGTPAREYELRGQVIAVDQARQRVTIRHEDIPRFMPGMTMAFRVADPGLLQGRVPGDLVTGTLVVRDTEVILRALRRTGFSAVPPSVEPLPMVILSPHENVADSVFVDESGGRRRLADWRGKTVAVTFMYTRCPLPNYCPLMDRHFKNVQDQVLADPVLVHDVQLLSVTLDPQHDTPDVLAHHAAILNANPAVWRFLTGEAGDIDRFARQFGVAATRGEGPEIVHNLQTAIVDRHGRLVTILNGNEWTPSQLMTGLRQARADQRQP